MDNRGDELDATRTFEAENGGGSTYVLRDLDVGEGVLGGLRGQGPDAEGGGDGGQAGGRHHFSLVGRKKTERTKQPKSDLRSEQI